MVSNDEVWRYLETVDFPAGKAVILAEAERLDAPEGVLKALRALPPDEYANRGEVLRSAGTDLAPEETARDRAVKARDRTHQRVAEALRPPAPPSL
jgi:hypothetical protein